MLLSLLACEAPETPADEVPAAVVWDDARLSVRLLDAGAPNVLLPDLIVGDSVSGRVWLHATDRTLVSVRADTGEISTIERLSVGSEPVALSVDAGGGVWMAANEGVVAYDPRSNVAEVVDVGGRTVTKVFGLAAGTAVAAGGGDGGAWVARVTVSGGLGEVRTLGGTLGSAAIDETSIAVVSQIDKDAPTLTVMNLDDLATVESCEAPMLATRLAAVPGAWVMTLPDEVARMDCATGVTTSIVHGDANVAIAVIGEDFQVFDHGTSLAGGIARRYDAALAETDSFATPPHTPSVWYDTMASELWMVGEDTSVLRTATVDGETVRDLRLGEHVESAIADPENPDHVFFTGRLTSTVGRVDLETGEVVLARDVGVWPIQPVVAEGWLWVLDQSDTVLRALDMDTLEIVAVYDLGRPNALRVFGDLAFSEERGTLWLTDTNANELVEVDPDTGVELASFALGGGAVRGAATVGRAELLLEDDIAWVVRTSDGAVTRVTLGDGATIEAAVDGLIGQLEAAWVDTDVLAAGGTLLDARTLAPIGEVPLDRVLDRAGDGWMGWSEAAHALVVVGADGATLGEHTLDEARRTPGLEWNRERRQVTWTTFETASVSREGIGAWLESLEAR